MALRLLGSGSGYIELKAPASAGDNTLTLPTNNGSANTFLKTDGSGNLSWQSNLTFDGTKLTVSGGSNTTQAVFSGTGGSGSRGLEIVTESVGAADEGVIFNARASGTTGRLKFNTNGATALTILGNGGNVGIGRTDPGHKLAILGGASSQLEIKGTEADFWLTSTGGGSDKAWRILGSTGGSTHRFRIYDNANGKEPFYIIGSSGSNTQHVHVNSGNLVFDAAGTGIDFSGSQTNAAGMTSETLNSYEEGTWTPAYQNVSVTTYGHQSGRYTKIGRFVYCVGQITVDGGLDTSDGSAVAIGGLPFTGNSAHQSAQVTLGKYTSILTQASLESFTNANFAGTLVALLDGNENNLPYTGCNATGILQFAITYAL